MSKIEHESRIERESCILEHISAVEHSLLIMYIRGEVMTVKEREILKYRLEEMLKWLDKIVIKHEE